MSLGPPIGILFQHGSSESQEKVGLGFERKTKTNLMIGTANEALMSRSQVITCREKNKSKRSVS